jgi:hypothetical protein
MGVQGLVGFRQMRAVVDGVASGGVQLTPFEGQVRRCSFSGVVWTVL